MAQSAVMHALAAVDAPDAAQAPLSTSLAASHAKCALNDLALHGTNEAVQMHGGIGVTDELDIGLFLKRARVAIQLFGDSGFHKNRYAALNGY